MALGCRCDLPSPSGDSRYLAASEKSSPSGFTDVMGMGSDCRLLAAAGRRGGTGQDSVASDGETGVCPKELGMSTIHPARESFKASWPRVTRQHVKRRAEFSKFHHATNSGNHGAKTLTYRNPKSASV